MINSIKPIHTPPSLTWRNTLGVTLLGCLILGLGIFVLMAGYLVRTTTLINGALWLSLSFAVSFAFILTLIILRQRAHGKSLVELGWRKPT